MIILGRSVPLRFLIPLSLVIIGLVVFLAFAALLSLVLAWAGLVTAAHSVAQVGPGRDHWGFPRAAVTYHEASSHPEASLYSPGAHLIKRFGGQEQQVPFGGRSAAFAGGILETDADASQMYAWYRNWLTAHGWHPYDSPMLSTWKSRQAYARDSRERFIVAVDNPHLLGLTIDRHLPSGQTIFEIRYTILPYKTKG